MRRPAGTPRAKDCVGTGLVLTPVEVNGCAATWSRDESLPMLRTSAAIALALLRYLYRCMRRPDGWIDGLAGWGRARRMAACKAYHKADIANLARGLMPY
jgi:hypothetical protein